MRANCCWCLQSNSVEFCSDRLVSFKDSIYFTQHHEYIKKHLSHLTS